MVNLPPSAFRLPPSADRKLAVVVLSWNGREDTVACLESLQAAGHPAEGERVYVVDNGSADGTLEAVRPRFPWAEAIRNETNLGFAGGNNVGIRRALKEGFRYLLLLNNDTAVRPGALAALTAELDGHPEAGSVQPVLLSYDGKRIDSLGIRVSFRPGAVDAGAGAPVSTAAAAPEEIFGPCAAAACYRASAIEKAGLLDEGLFAILEDVDLAFRLRLHGYGSRLVRSASVMHKRGISGKKAPGDFRRALVLRNLQILMWRYWPARSVWLCAPLWARWHVIARSLWRKMGRGEEYSAALLSARRERRALHLHPRLAEIQRRWL
jgi:hypothetical protein